MSKINEQIQRLRDVLVTCYNAIKRKGGTIPEAGERTLLNMPAAVMSIPQTQGVLTELKVTQNGEYLPADYDADGFSKVTAEFDTSSLPKSMVKSFAVDSNCVDENGYWDGSGIDTSNVTSFYNTFSNINNLKSVNIKDWNVGNVTSFQLMFYRCRTLESVDMSGWDVSNVANISCIFQDCNALKSINLDGWKVDSLTNIAQAFLNCFVLERLDLHNWVTNKITDFTYVFSDCKALKWLDITGWDVSAVTKWGYFLTDARAIETFVGDRTIDEVINNNITCFGGLKTSLFILTQNKLNRASLRAVINGLADLTGQTPQVLEMGTTNIAKLTEEDIAIATSKNWTIV